MTPESVPNSSSETWAKASDPSFAMSSSSRLPGTPPSEDEEKGKQMEREQQMHEIAEQIGTILGKTVNRVRHLPERVRGGLHLVKGQTQERAGVAAEAASDLAQSVSERISGLRRDAAQTAAEWRKEAERRTTELNQLAQKRIAEARSRAASATRENPIQMILGFAAASFIIGFGLRIWRSSRG